MMLSSLMLPIGLILAISAVAITSATGAQETQPSTLRLWQGEAPGAKGAEDADNPTITIYRPPAEKANGAAVVVCPGGGYGALAAHEGKPVAEWLNSLGVTGI